MGLLSTLLNESEMEDAKRKLEEAQKSGIDILIWNIANLENADYPNYERNIAQKILRIKREFKSDSETAKDYISRLIEEGAITEHEQDIFVTLKSVALNFKFRGKEKIERLESRIFYDTEERIPTFANELINLQNVNGLIPVRYNIIVWDYKKWGYEYQFDLNGNPVTKPDKIEFI